MGGTSVHDQRLDATPPQLLAGGRADRGVTSTYARELTDLYENLAPRLERIVRLDVEAPDAVIEDACQFAWSRLLDHFDRVRRESALSWLATTAVREAFRSIRRAKRELPLEGTLDARAEAAFPAKALSPDELLDHAERLRSLRTLPPRQQRLLWLQGLGLTYREMASHERCTRRTVERQLLRAKGSLRTKAVIASPRASELAR
jgi:RNA polymerase sigma factor (sigma-70 family)